MKNKSLLLVVLIVLLSFTGCMSMITGKKYYTEKIENTEITYQTSMDFGNDIENSTYSIRLSEVNNKKTILGGKEESTIFRYMVLQKELDGIKHYLSLGVDYFGNDWIFMSGEVKIKVDEGLITLIDENPYHKVISGGQVFEGIRLQVYDEDVNKIQTSESIVIQYHNEPMTFSDIDTLIVKDFLSKYYGKSYEEMKSLYEIRTQ
ncbi:MAG: hypothetical protein PF693_17305 [Spirochaetia bacterium]|jgi:hypothetical protein|nr:hypothetical protein [Spirochaetia bacterium]